MKTTQIKFRHMSDFKKIEWRGLGLSFYDLPRNCVNFHSKMIRKTEKNEEVNFVIVVRGGRGYIYFLDSGEAKKYINNGLSVIPPNCCNAVGGESRYFNPARDEAYGSVKPFLIRLSELL